jgi:small subunit ribosomal protein S5
LAYGEDERDKRDLTDTVITINRVSKVVKGGRRFSFGAIVVVGDENGSVGVGHGKANEVPDAIQKANDQARRDMVTVPIIEETIPYTVVGEHNAGEVLLKPAYKGTGVIAGGPVRAILEAAGLKNVLTKSLGSNTPHNVVGATIEGLRELWHPEEYRRRLGQDVDVEHVPAK